MKHKSRLEGNVSRLTIDEILHVEDEFIGLFLYGGHPKLQLYLFLVFLAKIDDHSDGYVWVLVDVGDDFVVGLGI